jgi:hypothetical protein
VCRIHRRELFPFSSECRVRWGNYFSRPSNQAQPKADGEIHVPRICLKVPVELTYHCHAGCEFTVSQIAHARKLVRFVHRSREDPSPP